MSTIITREILENYLKCPYKAHLQIAGERGSMSDYEILHIELRKQVRTEAEDKLIRDQKCDVLRDLTLTPDVLKRGVPLLVDVTAEIEGISMHFDGLRRSEGSSMLGDFHYIPILFRECGSLGHYHKALLELLSLILSVLQGKVPLWGILIHGQGREVRKIKLGGGTVQAQRTLQQIKEMHRTGTLPSLRLNSHCYVCEFCQRCQADATSKDDLSLLRGMGPKEIIKYNRRGIFTITQLSCTFRAKKCSNRSKQKSQSHQHALKALAIRENKIYVIGNPELPTGSAASIYFDVEGDPERGFDYLLGMVVDVNGSEKRYSFWADSSADEALIFQEFLDILSVHGDFQLYTYGSYEAAFLRRMIKTSSREDFLKNILTRSLNVLSIIYQHVYFPTYSNSLKEIGRYLGFNWTETNASGVQSLVWRSRWENTGSATLKEKLTTYNIEDCLALKKVTQFLYSISPPHLHEPGTTKIETYDGHPISHVEQIDPN